MFLTPLQQQQIRNCVQDDIVYKNVLNIITASPSLNRPANGAEEEKYRQLFELEADAVLFIDSATGAILDANTAAVALFGYSRDELLGMKNTDLSAEPTLTQQAVSEQHVLVPIRYLRRREGTLFPAEITVRYFNWQAREVYLASFRDITSRLEAEAEQRAGEERYQRLFDLLPNGVVIHRQGTIMLANRAAARILKVADPAEVVGQSAFNFVHPDYRALALKRIQQIRESGGGADPVEEKFVRADGLTIEVDVAAIPFVYGGEPAVMVVFEDITERKKAQQQTLELTLERERLQVLSNFIQYASHEFRTPLSIISNGLYLMTKVTDPERRREHETDVMQQIRRITDLLDDMLLMAKLESGELVKRAALSLNHLLHAVTAAVHNTPSYQEHRVVLELAGNLPIIEGDESLLYRAFANLLSNALRYTPSGGKVTVRSYLEATDIIVEVQDTGIGMDAESLMNSFKLFYRADQSHTTPGFGLGLPITRQIITRHGGSIEAISQIGQGSLFRVVLPLTR